MNFVRGVNPNRRKKLLSRQGGRNGARNQGGISTCFSSKGFQLFAADSDTGSESPEASGNEKVCKGLYEGSGNTKRKQIALLGNPFGPKCISNGGCNFHFRFN